MFKYCKYNATIWRSPELGPSCTPVVSSESAFAPAPMIRKIKTPVTKNRKIKTPVTKIQMIQKPLKKD